jgi:hypothetical protein
MSREGTPITFRVTDDQVVASSISFEAQETWDMNTDSNTILDTLPEALKIYVYIKLEANVSGT